MNKERTTVVSDKITSWALKVNRQHTHSKQVGKYKSLEPRQNIIGLATWIDGVDEGLDIG